MSRERNKDVDVVIVGAGVSGLYFAYRMKQQMPHLKYLIVEKHRIGGRAGNEYFKGVRVVIGAGIGRHNKDKALLGLIKELELSSHDFIANKQCLGISEIDMGGVINKLKKEFRARGCPAVTFKKFAADVLGAADYKKFLDTSGYTDYEREDCGEVLYHYSMTDNYRTFSAFSVPWNDLVQKLSQEVGGARMEKVTSIAPYKPANKTAWQPPWNVTTNRGKYKCSYVVIATDATCLRELIPLPIYRRVKGQPFIRVYGKFTESSTALIKSTIPITTHVCRPLQKIIPMSGDVYMIAYSDNASAVYLSKYQEDTPANRNKYSALLKLALGLDLKLEAIKAFYWESGTHYYTPYSHSTANCATFERDRSAFLAQLRRPLPGLYVIGEAVSGNQGWTNSAILTADEAITHFNKDIAAQIKK